MGQPEWAEPFYVEALAIYRLHPEAPHLDLANAIRSLALLKGEEGKGEEARALWEEARELYRACDVSAGVSESEARLSLL